MEPYETSLYEPRDSPDSDSTISGPDDPKRQLILSLNCWVVHCIIPGVVVMAYVRVVPTIRQGAEDLGIELPVVSQWVFYLANTMASYWYLIVAAQVMINLLFAIALAYVSLLSLVDLALVWQLFARDGFAICFARCGNEELHRKYRLIGQVHLWGAAAQMVSAVGRPISLRFVDCPH